MTGARADLIRFVDLHPAADDFRRDAPAGLRARPKSIAPKYFYDRRGSAIFERITELPEYYPTRVEIALLERRADEIAELLGEAVVLIEFGSGASRKVRVLLDALGDRASRYVPIDISRGHLLDSAAALAEDYPSLDVAAVCADYTAPAAVPPELWRDAERRVIFFPGSTIGNFSPNEARRFLRQSRETAGAGGALLIGVDLKKDAGVLEAAYNDAQGVTAEFNMNLLRRMNRELGADFDLDAFEHLAIYNAAEGRVEMHLKCLRGGRVEIAGESIEFEAGETIHTENSYKFGVEEFQALASECGFALERVWTDAEDLFSVHLLRVP